MADRGLFASLTGAFCLRPALTRLRFLVALLALSGAYQARAQEQVIVYNTYLLPPFVSELGGLAEELVGYLNRKLAGEYHLQLENLPRARLMRTVLKQPESFAGIVLFLNPRFVGDVERTRYHWSPVLYRDANVLVFLRGNEPHQDIAKGLQGLRFGGILDYRYAGIDALVGRGDLVREDASSELHNLRKVLGGRVDFTQTNRSFFVAMSGMPVFGGRLTTLPTPFLPGFSRHILIGKGNPVLAQRIATLFQALEKDAGWKALMRLYNPSVLSTQPALSAQPGKSAP